MGQVAREVDAVGGVTTYTYDVVGRLIRVSPPDDTEASFTYDTVGNLATATDAKGETARFEYDAEGRRVATIDRGGNRWSTEYDALGQVIATIDPAGNRSETEYDELGRAVRWVDPLGGASSATYDAVGNRLTFTDALGATTRSTYNGMNRLTGVKLADGSRESYVYDGRGAVISTTDVRGFETTYTYDSLGRQLTITDADGATWQNVYDSVGNVVETVDPTGERTQFRYNAVGQQIAVVDALGNTTSTSYDAAGDVVSTIDALGAKTTYGYDAAGRLTTTTLPSGAATSVAYDANGNPVRVTDPRGFVVEVEYDALDHAVRQTDPAGGVSVLARDALGRVVGSTDASGNSTRYDYDALGRVIRTTDPEGHVSESAYDAVGNLTRATDRLGGVTTYAYDALGRLTSSTDPTGATRSTTYDAGGNVTSQVDPAGVVTAFAYDPVGRLTSTVENAKAGAGSSASVNVTTTTAYNKRGLPASVTDPRGNVTAFEHDALGRLTARTNPLGETTTTAYDAAGRVATTRAADGATTTFGYNPDGLLTSIAYPGQTVTFGYDAAGNRTSMTDPIGTATWLYDWAGRVTSETDSAGHTIDRTYDASGNATGISYGDGRTIARTFDGRGLALTQADATGTTSFMYDAMGEVTGVERPSGVNTTIQRDADGRIVGVVHSGAGADAVGATFAYAYDSRGLLDSRTFTVGGAARATSYEHDALGRLVRSDADGYVSTYTWDAASNLIGETRSDDPATSKPGDGASDARTVDAANRLLSVVSTPASGQANKAETTTLTYDGRGNRTAAVTTVPQGPSKTRTIAETHYAYDARDLLVDIGGDEDATWARDGLGRALRVTDAGAERERAFDGFALVLDGGATLTPAPYGGVLSEVSDGVLQDVLGDMQGSPVASATDGVVSSDLALFGDFGDELDAKPASGHTSTVTSVGFTGQPSVAGLVEFATRTYDPTTRTWLQADSYAGTAARSSSLNRYAYVEGAPETFVDVLGFWRGQDAFDAYMATLDGNVGKPWTVSAGEFVERHQGDIIGGLVTVGCTLVTGGTGVLGCVAVGSAISGGMNYVANTPAEDRTFGGLVLAAGERATVDVALTVATGGVLRLAAPVLRAGARVVTQAVPSVVRESVSSAVRSVVERLPGTAASVQRVGSGVAQGVRPWARSTVRKVETAAIETAGVEARVSAPRIAADFMPRAANTVDSIPTVNWGQQAKHFPGHQNYMPGRSQLTANPETLIQRAGTGTPVGNVPRGQAGFRERIDFGDTIGTYIARDGSSSPTSIGILHYRADGSAHIVPGRP